jgi:RHS repeat-associated protein
MGRITNYGYDSKGRLTSETLPDTTNLTWSYGTGGALTSQKNAYGGTTNWGLDAGGHQTTMTDPLSHTTSYAYDGNGSVTTMTDPRGNATHYAYDSARRLTTTTNALSGVTTLTFDANGNVTTTTDPLGRTTTTSYDAMGRLTTAIDPLGGNTAASYDAAGLGLTTTNARGVGTQTHYDPYARGLVTEQEAGTGSLADGGAVSSFDAGGEVTLNWDADGSPSQMVYDVMGRVTQATDALGGVTLSRYDLDGELIQSRNALGKWTAYAYNSRGWVTQTTDVLGHQWQTAYNGAGDVTGTTDPLTHTTATGYDTMGRVTSTTDGAGNSTATSYDAAGNVSTTTDGKGHVTSYAYDPLNRRTMTTVAVGTSVQATSTVAYDAVGNVTSSTDFLGHVTVFGYDKLNRQTTATDPLSHTVTTAYDPVGNATAVTDALGKTTNSAFDGLDRTVQTTDPLGNTAYTALSVMGKMLAGTDPLGHSKLTAYDLAGRATSSIDALGGQTKTGYDSGGNTKSVTDAVGNQTAYLNDDLGRPTTTTDPLSHQTATTYDNAGNVSTVTDPDGRQQVFAYDGDNRATAVTWKSGSVTVNSLSYAYDGDGNQTSAGDNNGSYTNSYDARDRLTSQTNPFGLSLTYKYDAGSRLTERDDSLSGVLTFVYDNADRLTSEKFGGSGMTQARVDLGYNNRGDVTSLTRYSDTAGSTLVGTTVYAYDDARNVTAITNKNASAATLSYYNYALDGADRVTSETWQSQTTTASLISGTHTYTYDATDQLTSADATAFSYDANGNRTMAGYTTGSANELTNDGTWTYTYDNSGDLTEKSKGAGLETWYYGYDTIHRLVSVQQTSNGTTLLLTATYTYDVLNHRIQEDKWQSGGNTVTTRTDYDGGQAWADTNSSNVATVRYVSGQGGQALYARIDVGVGLRQVSQDRLGAVRDVWDGTGVLDHIEYAAFGGFASQTGAANRGAYSYTGLRQDGDTGLVFADRRTLLVTTGRWLQEDPIGFGAGDGDLFRYVGNDPTNATDPTGGIVIFVHGYNDDGKTIAAALRQGMNDANDPQPLFRFEWHGLNILKGTDKKEPGLELGTDSINWGTMDNEYAKKAVSDLRKVIAIARARLDDLQKTTGTHEEINIVAHSLGAQIAMRAIADGAKVDNLITFTAPEEVRKAPNELGRVLDNISGHLVHAWDVNDILQRLPVRRAQGALWRRHGAAHLTDQQSDKIHEMPLGEFKQFPTRQEMIDAHTSGYTIDNAGLNLHYVKDLYEPFLRSSTTWTPELIKSFAHDLEESTRDDDQDGRRVLFLTK